MIQTMKPLAIVLLSAVILAGCFGQRKVERVNPDETIDLSGRWNDSDSKRVAEKMISSVLEHPWLTEFEVDRDRKPVVIVGLVRNKTHEHISTETFIKDVERQFINSGKIRLVQAGDKREELRQERGDQQEFASEETAKEWGKELGADFMMQGTVNSIVDQYKKEKVVSYKVNLELANLETNEIVWIGDKEIKKYITN